MPWHLLKRPWMAFLLTLAFIAPILPALESSEPSPCYQDWSACDGPRDVIADGQAGTAAPSASERAAAKHARHGEPEWPGLSFQGYLPERTDLDRGRIALVETYGTFPDATGNRREVGVVCVYDLAAQDVIDVEIRR